jgi:hypothetical protein
MRPTDGRNGEREKERKKMEGRKEGKTWPVRRKLMTRQKCNNSTIRAERKKGNMQGIRILGGNIYMYICTRSKSRLFSMTTRCNLRCVYTKKKEEEETGEEKST